MIKKAEIMTFLFVVLGLYTVAVGSIIYVDDDGLADFNNIQDAINYSLDGDIIEVQPGTYYENIDFSGKKNTLMGMDPNFAGYIVPWGSNLKSQCNVPGGNDFVDIAAGYSHGLALK
jgi:hypothetical protein